MPIIHNLYYSLAKTNLRSPLVWYRHLQIQQNDVMIASYPRSGNTWLRFLLFELLAGCSADFETINQADSFVPELRNLSQAPTPLPGNGRLIKTHEPFRSEYQNAIYLVRDPRDVAISEYYFLKRKGIEYASFDHFLTQFLRGKVNGFGSWSQHVNSWFTSQQLGKARILVIKYEDLHAVTAQTLEQVLAFLNLVAKPEAVQTAIQNNRFQNMQHKEEKARKTVYEPYPREINFIRQGTAYGWKNDLSSQQAQKIENSFRKLLIPLQYLK